MIEQLLDVFRPFIRFIFIVFIVYLINEEINALFTAIVIRALFTDFIFNKK